MLAELSESFSTQLTVCHSLRLYAPYLAIMGIDYVVYLKNLSHTSRGI